MIRLYNYTIGILIVLLCAAIPSLAQENTRSITQEQKVKIIEQMSTLLNDNYVFPEIAARIEKHLKTKLNDGSFEKITDKKEFSQLLTDEVQLISKDKHMRVRLRPAQPLSPTAKPNPIAEFYEFRASMKEDNYGFARIEKLEDNVGLLEITGFPPLELAKEYADMAMKLLEGSDALIVDCRRNGGGSPDLIQYLCSYLFEKPTHINSIYNRTTNVTEDYITLSEVTGQKLSDVPVFVLTSKRTFSGGEEFAYDIQTQKRGLIIGETTGGGANPGDMFPVSDDMGIFIPTGRAINPVTKTNWEGTGVKPDIEIEASKALDTALVLARKDAMEHRKTRDRAAYKIIDKIGLNMEKAEQLFTTGNTVEAEKLIHSTIEEGMKENMLSEEAINLIGYEFLGKNYFALAVTVFKTNVVYNPESANVYDSLGEAYMKFGDNENAIINYTKSLNLNPKNANASEMLKKMVKK